LRFIERPKKSKSFASSQELRIQTYWALCSSDITISYFQDCLEVPWACLDDKYKFKDGKCNFQRRLQSPLFALLLG